VFRHRPNNYQLARDTFVVAALACQAGTAFLFLPASKFAFFAMPMRARRISGTAKKRTRQTNFLAPHTRQFITIFAHAQKQSIPRTRTGHETLRNPFDTRTGMVDSVFATDWCRKLSNLFLVPCLRNVLILNSVIRRLKHFRWQNGQNAEKIGKSVIFGNIPLYYYLWPSYYTTDFLQIYSPGVGNNFGQKIRGRRFRQRRHSVDAPRHGVSIV